jgi:hypothetical protein
MSSQQPRYVKMHDNDNVVIIANNGGLPAGTVLDNGIELREAIPQGHKVALTDLAAGDVVRRYNVVIGYARTICRSPRRKRRWILSKAIRSRASAIRTAASARATSWPFPLRCNACPASSPMQWSASAPSCCRSTPMSTM